MHEANLMCRLIIRLNGPHTFYTSVATTLLSLSPLLDYFDCSLCFTIALSFFFLSSLPYSHATITKLQQKSPRPVSIRSERALLQLNQYLQFTNEKMAGPERLRTLLCFRLGESSLASFLLVPYSCYPAC